MDAITVSLCMIVKNEEAVLRRCLDGVKDLMDEIIIVDTGSTDRTKEIAKEYTGLVYDFEWCDDFSAARNYAFSKATMDYIYSADADEVLDEENQKQFGYLKQCMVPEVEIVQMHYLTRAKHNTVENFCDELRPKLFKRVRGFTWIDPVHETIRLMPLVFDSDIKILHLPEESHGKRDFSIFEKNTKKEEGISNRIGYMYAKELYKCGDVNDLGNAVAYFESKKEDPDMQIEAYIVLARFYRYCKDLEKFRAEIIENLFLYEYSEICYEMGEFFLELGENEVAMDWFARAMTDSRSVVSIESTGALPLGGLERANRFLGREEEAKKYEQMKENWKLPCEGVEGE